MKTIWLGSNILINILTWKQYINLKTVGIVARLNQTLRIIEYPPESKLFIKLYFPLVLVVWGQAAKTHANSNYFCCKGVPFVWFTLAIIQLTRFHFLRPLSMLYFKSVAILMQGFTNNLAPHNILRGLFNTTRIKYMFITTLDRQEVITKLTFQDWINKAIIFKIGGHNMELHTSEYRKNPKHTFKKKIHDCLPQISPFPDRRLSWSTYP